MIYKVKYEVRGESSNYPQQEVYVQAESFDNAVDKVTNFFKKLEIEKIAIVFSVELLKEIVPEHFTDNPIKFITSEEMKKVLLVEDKFKDIKDNEDNETTRCEECGRGY